MNTSSECPPQTQKIQGTNGGQTGGAKPYLFSIPRATAIGGLPGGEPVLSIDEVATVAIASIDGARAVLRAWHGDGDSSLAGAAETVGAEFCDDVQALLENAERALLRAPGDLLAPCHVEALHLLGGARELLLAAAAIDELWALGGYAIGRLLGDARNALMGEMQSAH